MYTHYFKNVKNLDVIDVYRILKLYNVTDPCIQHAIKKLLVAGDRGAKGIEKDIQEAIDSLERWKKIQSEDSNQFTQHDSINSLYNMNWNVSDMLEISSLTINGSDRNYSTYNKQECFTEISDGIGSVYNINYNDYYNNMNWNIPDVVNISTENINKFYNNGDYVVQDDLWKPDATPTKEKKCDGKCGCKKSTDTIVLTGMNINTANSVPIMETLVLK